MSVDGPWSITTSLQPNRASRVKLFHNVSSFDKTQLAVFWENSTTCVLEAKALPISSMWKEEGCKLTLSTGPRTNSKKGIIDGKLRMKNLPEFEPITATYSSNGAEKIFVFDPPFTELVLSQEGAPTIRYKRGGSGICRTVPNRLAVVLNGVKHESRLNGKKVGQYEFPVEWYEQLEAPEKISVELSGDHYQSTHEFEVHPPAASYFRPLPVNVVPICSPEKGYYVRFDLEPLSPSLRSFNGNFIQSDGVKRTFEVNDGRGIIQFTDRVPTPDEEPKLSISGHLLLDDYSGPTTEPVPLRFEYLSHCQLICQDLMRTDPQNSLEITAHGNWSGSGSISLRKDESFTVDNVPNQTPAQNAENAYQFPIKAGENITLSPAELREKIPILDQIFIQEQKPLLSFELRINPFDDSGVFPTTLFSFSVSREKEIISSENKFRTYVEGGKVQHWRFSYVEDYFPDQEKFQFLYAGAPVPGSLPEGVQPWINDKIPTTSSQKSLIYPVQMPEYKSVQDARLWELRYSGAQILTSPLTISQITFDPKVLVRPGLSSIINCIFMPESREFKGQEVLGKVNLNGNKSISINQFIEIGSDKIDLEPITLHEGEPTDLSSKPFFDGLNSLGLDPEKMSAQKIEFGLEIPSRESKIYSGTVRLGTHGAVYAHFVSFWVQTWDKKLSSLQGVESSDPLLYSHLCRAIWNDLHAVFEPETLTKTMNSSTSNGRNPSVRVSNKLKGTKYCIGILVVDGQYDSEMRVLLAKWQGWYTENTDSVTKDNQKQPYSQAIQELKELIKKQLGSNYEDYYQCYPILAKKANLASKTGAIAEVDRIKKELQTQKNVRSVGVATGSNSRRKRWASQIKVMSNAHDASLTLCENALKKLKNVPVMPEPSSPIPKNATVPLEKKKELEVSKPKNLEPTPPEKPLQSRRSKNTKVKAPEPHRGARKGFLNPPPQKKETKMPKEEVDKLYATRDHWTRQTTDSRLRNSYQSKAKTKLQQHIKDMKKKLGDDYTD